MGGDRVWRSISSTAAQSLVDVGAADEVVAREVVGSDPASCWYIPPGRPPCLSTPPPSPPHHHRRTPTVQPVYWEHDHALFTYPLPDALVLADSAPAAVFEFDSCSCLNPVGGGGGRARRSVESSSRYMCARCVEQQGS